MSAGAAEICRRAGELAAALPGGWAYALHGRSVELPTDPLALFAAHAGQGRVLVWHGDGWLLTVGAAEEVEAGGPGRAFHLAEAHSAMRTRTVTDRPELPALLVAMTFEDRSETPDHWGERAPVARLLMPKRLYWRRRDGRCLIADARRVSAGAACQPDELLAEPPILPVCAAAPWPANNAADYRELVREAIAQIELGGLRKVVCARAIDHQLPQDIDLGSSLRHLHRHSDSHTYVYARDNDDGSCFIGATPELLFHAAGQDLTVLSLAGSRPRGDDPAGDEAFAAELLASTKERKEHQLVIEHLARQLRGRAEQVRIPPTPTIRRLARLQHLETVIRCHLPEPDPFDLCAALAPTPAVAGLPREAAIEWLRRHEAMHRGLYTGTLGLIAPDLARFIVPLRGGIIRGRQARLFAGAGIVETSDPEAEWAETELKLRPMRQALGIEQES